MSLHNPPPSGIQFMCRSDPACSQQNLEGTHEIQPARVVFMCPSFGGETASGVTGGGFRIVCQN